MDPTADITDLFTWMTPDGNKVVLVMDLYPAAPGTAKFSNAVKYSFHILEQADFTHPPSGHVDIICTFDTTQKISCWVVDSDSKMTLEYLTGDASAATGLASGDGKVTVFAGLRDDPFFFNLDGFKAAAALVQNVAGSLMFDTAGCPMLTQTMAQAAVATLGSNGMGGAPKDHFAGQNVLSIVMTVDKTLLTGAGPLLRVWASTNK
jgi:hypothetical protein